MHLSIDHLFCICTPNGHVKVVNHNFYTQWPQTSYFRCTLFRNENWIEDLKQCAIPYPTCPMNPFFFVRFVTEWPFFARKLSPIGPWFDASVGGPLYFSAPENLLLSSFKNRIGGLLYAMASPGRYSPENVIQVCLPPLWPPFTPPDRSLRPQYCCNFSRYSPEINKFWTICILKPYNRGNDKFLI